MSFLGGLLASVRHWQGLRASFTDVYNHRGYRIQVQQVGTAIQHHHSFRILCPRGDVILNTENYGDCRNYIDRYVQDDRKLRGRAVIVLHGFGDTSVALHNFARHLCARNTIIYHIDYSSRMNDFESIVGSFSHIIDTIQSEEDYDNIHIVGFGYGGIIATEVLNRMGRKHWHKGCVIAVGAPLTGSSAVTRLARLPGVRKVFGASLHPLTKGAQPATPLLGQRMYSLYGEMPPTTKTPWPLDKADGANDGIVIVEETKPQNMPIEHAGCVGSYSHSSIKDAKPLVDLVLMAISHNEEATREAGKLEST